jgi:hypothetical protein
MGMQPALGGLQNHTESDMTQVNKSCPWIVVNDGKIASAHRRPETAQSAAARVGGAVGTQPAVGRAAQIVLQIGQRVRIDAGAVLPV